MNDTEKSEFESLDRYSAIIGTLIFNVGRTPHMDKFQLMKNLTPNCGLDDLVDSEIKRIREDLVNNKVEYREAIENAITTVRNWLDIAVFGVQARCTDYTTDEIEKNFRNWLRDFIQDFIGFSFDEHLLVSEIMIFDEKTDDEITDKFWNEIESLPTLKEFLDIIDLVFYFIYLFLYKHNFKKWVQDILANQSYLNIEISNLATGLIFEQKVKLFELLVEGGLVKNTIDSVSFNWIFGDQKQRQPDQWKPIAWNKSKQAFWELLEPILGTITNRHKRDIEKLFLDEYWKKRSKNTVIGGAN
jgi:hypothetical protein